jgi:hypothetical protein
MALSVLWLCNVNFICHLDTTMHSCRME